MDEKRSEIGYLSRGLLTLAAAVGLAGCVSDDPIESVSYQKAGSAIERHYDPVTGETETSYADPSASDRVGVKTRPLFGKNGLLSGD